MLDGRIRFDSSSNGLFSNPLSLTLARNRGLAVIRHSGFSSNASSLSISTRAPACLGRAGRALFRQRASLIASLSPALAVLPARWMPLSTVSRSASASSVVYGLDIGDGVDLARDVHDVVVDEAAHHVDDAVGLADLARNLLPRPSPFDAPATSPRYRRTRRPAGMVFSGFAMSTSGCRRGSGTRRSRRWALSCKKGSSPPRCRLGQPLNSGLADIRQTDYSAFKAHDVRCER